METNIWRPYGQFDAFDYGKMADQADSRRDFLQSRLRERRAQGPEDPGMGKTWEWENRVLYSMYLEERALARELRRRAARA